MRWSSVLRCYNSKYDLLNWAVGAFHLLQPGEEQRRSGKSWSIWVRAEAPTLKTRKTKTNPTKVCFNIHYAISISLIHYRSDLVRSKSVFKKRGIGVQWVFKFFATLFFFSYKNLPLLNKNFNISVIEFCAPRLDTDCSFQELLLFIFFYKLNTRLHLIV